MVKRALVWYNHLSYRHGLSFDSLAEHLTGVESDEAGSLNAVTCRSKPRSWIQPDELVLCSRYTDRVVLPVGAPLAEGRYLLLITEAQR